MQKKKIGVIVPCYNHVNFVEEAIESILHQTCQDFDIYAADDASTDGTQNKLIQYEDKIREIHLFEENQGGQVTFLLNRVENEYVALLNSDDFWYPEKLEKQLKYLEEHPECAACFTWCRQVDESGVEIKGIQAFHQKNRSKEEWMRYFFEEGNSFSHPSILIRREIYQKLLGNLYRGFWQIPDFQMWVQLVQKENVHVIEEELMAFRWHDSEVSVNVSAPSEKNIARHMNEECYMWYDTIKNMEEQYFVKAFQDLLLVKEPKTIEEIQCEKFFVLTRCRNEMDRQAAIFYFYDIYKDKKVQVCFEERYNFRKKDFYELETKIGYAKIFLDNQEKKKLVREVCETLISLN